MSVTTDYNRIHGTVIAVGTFGNGEIQFAIRVDDLLHPLNGQSLMVGTVREGTELKSGLRVSFLYYDGYITSASSGTYAREKDMDFKDITGYCKGIFAIDIVELKHPEIHLSEKDWWEEIGRLELPEELKGLLRSLVSDTINNCIMPVVTMHRLKLAREYLSDVIICLGERKAYYVTVYVPDDTDQGRYAFFLSPCYPKGTMRRLEEF